MSHLRRMHHAETCPADVSGPLGDRKGVQRVDRRNGHRDGQRLAGLTLCINMQVLFSMRTPVMLATPWRLVNVYVSSEARQPPRLPASASAVWCPRKPATRAS